jgi:hypothetical protein
LNNELGMLNVEVWPYKAYKGIEKKRIWSIKMWQVEIAKSWLLNAFLNFEQRTGMLKCDQIRYIRKCFAFNSTNKRF